MSSKWEVHLSHPGRSLRLSLVWLLVVILLPLAFVAGWLVSVYFSPVQPPADYQALLGQIQERDNQLQYLQQRLAVQDSFDKAGQQALEQNRLLIKQLDEQNFSLSQELAAYKNVLEPDSSGNEVKVRAFEVRRAEQPRRYRYKLVVNRGGNPDQLLEGKLQITIHGLQAGAAKAFELRALSRDMSGDAIALSFKYFQTFPEAGRFGELELPEGFVPEHVVITTQLTGSAPQEQVIAWPEPKP